MSTKDSSTGPSSRKGSTYSPRTEEEKVGYPTRLRRSSYEALMAAKAATGASGNSLVDDALMHYLASDAFKARLAKARTAQEEAIKKLSGG